MAATEADMRSIGGGQRGLSSAGAMGAGALIALQTQANGALGRELSAPLLAGLFSFGTGIVGLLAWSAVSRQGVRHFWAQRPRAWWLAGGVTGAVLVVSVAAAAPVIGLTLVAVSMVTGQIVGSLVVDRLGLSPLGRRGITTPRIAAAFVGLIALAIGVSGAGNLHFQPPVVVALAVIGASMAIGAAANGHLSRFYGQPATAALINFGVAFVCVGTAVVLAWLSGLLVPTWNLAPAWAYMGGLVGAAWLAASSALVRSLGVLRLFLSATAGQLIASVLIDLLAPISADGLTLNRAAGAALMVGAVVLAGWRAPPAGVPGSTSESKASARGS